MTSKIINLNKMSMHKRATYETLVQDTILNPKDKITLPNRLATQLRKTQKLSQFDNPDFIDLDETQQKIMTNQIQSQNVQQVITQSPPAPSAPVAKAMASVPTPAQTSFKQQPFPSIPKGPPTAHQPLGEESAAAALIADSGIDEDMAAASAEYSEQIKRSKELEEARKIKASISSTESLRKPTSLVQTIIQDFQQHMAAPKYPSLPSPKPHPYPAVYSPIEEVQRIYRHPAKAASSGTVPIATAPIEASASSAAAAAVTPESSATASSPSPTTKKKKTFTPSGESFKIPSGESFKIPYPSKVSTDYAIDLLTYAVKNNYLPGEETPDNILRLAAEYKSSKRKNPALSKQIKDKYNIHYEELRNKLNK